MVILTGDGVSVTPVSVALDSNTAIGIRFNECAVMILHHELAGIYRAKITCKAQLRNTLRLKKGRKDARTV